MSELSSGPMMKPEKYAHVCIVCWKRMAVAAGHCESCGADLVPLENEEAVIEVRNKADAHIARKSAFETAGVFLVSAAVFRVMPSFAGLLIWLVTTAIVGAAYAWLVPSSGIAIMAGRRRRVSRELGQDVQLQSASNFWWQYFLNPFYLPRLIYVWMPDRVMPEPPDPLDRAPDRIAAYLGAEPQR